jgi:hypothetical protein
MNGHEFGGTNVLDLNKAISLYLPGETEEKINENLCQYGQ